VLRRRSIAHTVPEPRDQQARPWLPRRAAATTLIHQTHPRTRMTYDGWFEVDTDASTLDARS
jgi:hypothetical protein